jgi:CHC2-type zinc finger protein
MPRLLETLGFLLRPKKRRCSCVLHNGENPSAFAWSEAGLWKCFSCGAGGDRISLVRAVKNCSFREAVAFLASLAGVPYSPTHIPYQELVQAKIARERAANTAWTVRDEISHLRNYYRDGLHRADRLATRLGEELLGRETKSQDDEIWERLARLASAQTFFLSAHDFLCRASVATLVHFAAATSEDRRIRILKGDHAPAQL